MTNAKNASLPFCLAPDEQVAKSWRDTLKKRAGGTFLVKAAKQFVIASGSVA